MVYEQLAALLLDKQTFGRTFLAYTVEVFAEIWPADCAGVECGIEIQQAVTKFETILDTIQREMMVGLPFKTLENATSVKQLSYKNETQQRNVLLVIVSNTGETTTVCNRNRARLLRSAFNVVHSKALMKEAVLQQSETIGNQKNAFRNSAIWAFTAERYWKRLAKDIAAVVDHSNILQDLNAHV